MKHLVIAILLALGTGLPAQTLPTNCYCPPEATVTNPSRLPQITGYSSRNDTQCPCQRGPIIGDVWPCRIVKEKQCIEFYSPSPEGTEGVEGGPTWATNSGICWIPAQNCTPPAPWAFGRKCTFVARIKVVLPNCCNDTHFVTDPENPPALYSCDFSHCCGDGEFTIGKLGQAGLATSNNWPYIGLLTGDPIAADPTLVTGPLSSVTVDGDMYTESSLPGGTVSFPGTGGTDEFPASSVITVIEFLSCEYDGWIGLHAECIQNQEGEGYEGQVSWTWGVEIECVDCEARGV